jgi:outer membrane protein OmpA-like peptidoglycan-associated protein
MSLKGKKSTFTMKQPTKTAFLLIFCLFCATILRGQMLEKFPNLVVNPSFEIRKIKKKPDSETNSDSLDVLLGWKSPSLRQSFVIGEDNRGFIEDLTSSKGQRDFKARTGHHVAQIQPFGTSSDVLTSNSKPRRSYLMGDLTEPLTIGQKYYIGFWIHYHCLGVTNVGMAFRTERFSSDTLNHLTLKPQVWQKDITNYDAKKIWTCVIDSFVADQAYQFCVIGNFQWDNATKSGGSAVFNHYVAFIDDVFVVKANDNSLPKPPQPPITSRTPKPVSPLPMVLNRVQFLYNSAEFEPVSLPELDSMVMILKQFSQIRILIKGYTSSEGATEYNQKLSERRAEAVKNYLILHGIAAQRLQTKGFGETQLLVTDDSEDNKRLNRRIELEILN